MFAVALVVRLPVDWTVSPLLPGSRHPRLSSEKERRAHYAANVAYVFDATAEVYYTYWGEFFHFAIFEPSETEHDFDRALERTHYGYLDLIAGRGAARILEIGCGGGAFAEWMADRASGQVLGIDLSETQLRRARARAARRAARGSAQNLEFRGLDVMRLDTLTEGPFDAAVCLDAACYFPDRAGALAAVASRLRSGARLLWVDWCRSSQVTGLQDELILEPFYRSWGIPVLESVSAYEAAFGAAGFRVMTADDLSERAAPNWDRAYRAANAALAHVPEPAQLARMVAGALRYGSTGARLLKEQYYAALLSKAAANSGILRYVQFVAERR